MSIRNQEVVYRINKYADFPQESRSFFLESGIVPTIDWEKVRCYDSVHTLPGSATITGTGTFRCFQVPIGKRYKIKRITIWSSDVGNTFTGTLYLGVEGNTITLNVGIINGIAYSPTQYIYLEFRNPIELKSGSAFSVVVGVKGGANSPIQTKMWGSITDDY